jgi:hypothetical protein
MDSEVLLALVRNPVVDELLVDGILAWSPAVDERVRAAYQERLATEPDAGDARWLMQDGYDADYRGRLSVEQTLIGTRDLGWRPDQLPDDAVNPDLVVDLLRRTDDAHLLATTMAEGHDEYRAVAAGNRRLPPVLLSRAVEDPSWEVRLAALGNSALPADLARVAAAEGIELAEREPGSIAADEIKRALAGNPGAPADVLVALAKEGYATAGFTLLAHVPQDGWGGYSLEELLDVAGGDADSPPLPVVPVAALRWPGRLALVDQYLCSPSRLLDHAKPGAADGGDFATVAHAMLDLVDEHPDDWWHPTSGMRWVRALVAEDQRCDGELADRLLLSHDDESTLFALASNPALDLDRRLTAMHAWTRFGDTMDDLLELERARSLGRSLIRAGRSPEDLVRLAARVDRMSDVMTALVSTTPEQLVRAAVRTP